MVLKIKQKCIEMGLPEAFASFAIYFVMNDQQNSKIALRELIRKHLKFSKKEEKGLDVLIELIFLKDSNQETLEILVTKTLLSELYHQNNEENTEDVIEALATIFLAIKNTTNADLAQFLNVVELLIKKLKIITTVPKIDTIEHMLRIAKGLIRSQPNYWNLERPVISLLHIQLTHILSKDSNVKVEERSYKLIHFISLLLPNYQAVTNFKTNMPLDSDEKLEVIKSFFDFIGLNQDFCKQKDLPPNFFANATFLALIYARQENERLPKSLVADMKQINISLDSNNSFANCFDLIQLCTNSPQQTYHRINQLYRSSNIALSVQEFLKILSCYNLEDFQAQYPSINVVQNTFFRRIAEIIKIEPVNLHGILDIIFDKKDSSSTDFLIKSLMERMNMQDTKFKTIRALIGLILSEDESVLMRAAEDLDLKHTKFLLVGKRILNPRFISAKEFEEVGLVRSELTNHVFDSSEEDYENWKADVRRSIQKKKQEYKDESRIPTSLNTVEFYLSKWKTHFLTKKNIQAALTLINTPGNGLLKILSNSGKDSLYDGLDVLVIVSSIRHLRQKEGEKIDGFDKEQSNALNTLALTLRINPDLLRNFILMFELKNNSKATLQYLFEFLPDEKQNETTYQRLFEYGQKQNDIAARQLAFVSKELPRLIQFSDEDDFKLPPGIFSRLFKRERAPLTINDFLYMVSATLKVLPADSAKEIMKECYTMALFAKGLCLKPCLRSYFKVVDPEIVGLIQVLIEKDLNKRLSLISSLFRDSNHPLKISLAIYGIMTRQNFSVRFSEDPKKIDYLPMKHYLGEILQIQPEAFDLFELFVERDTSKFIDKSSPLLRKLTNKPFFDADLFKSLLPLSLGKHFSSGYLAKKLNIPNSLITFFTTISRLAIKETREEELRTFLDQKTTKKVFSDLRVEVTELVALLKIGFNLLTDNNDLLTALQSLRLEVGSSIQENESNLRLGRHMSDETIYIEHLRGLLALNAQIQGSDITIEERLDSLKHETRYLFKSLDLDQKDGLPLIISRVAAGDYLIFKETEQHFRWAFPNNDTQALIAIRNLTMAVCGLINTKVQLTSNLQQEVELFISELGFNLKESQNHKLSDNSLAYPVYLTSQTLNIAPTWTQAFLLDKELFINLTGGPDNIITPEFLLAVVLNFTYMPKSLREFIGFYEWDLYCRKFYQENSKNQDIDTLLDNDEKGKTNTNELYRLFSMFITFDYKTIFKLAVTEKLLQNQYWQILLQTGTDQACEEIWNTSINKTLQSLLMAQGTDSSMVNQSFALPPRQFLIELIKADNVPPKSDQDIDIGKLMKDALSNTYNVLTKKVQQQGIMVESFEMTNLSVLGSLMFLRNNTRTRSSDEDVSLTLCQLALNIERKLCFNDCFAKFSKFNFVKLAGLSLGIKVRDELQAAFSETLFTTGNFESLYCYNSLGYIKGLAAMDNQKQHATKV